MACAPEVVLRAAWVPATPVLGVFTTGLGEELPSSLWLSWGGGGPERFKPLHVLRLPPFPQTGSRTGSGTLQPDLDLDRHIVT